MARFLDDYLPGITQQQFFDAFGLDPITWTVPHKPAPGSGDYPDPLQGAPGFLESRRVSNDNWRIYPTDISTAERKLTRYDFVTPVGTLSTVLEDAGYTTWVREPLIKQKRDIDLIGSYVTTPHCDVDAVNQTTAEYGERGLVRGHICSFDVFGQPGCWQDAACLVGTQDLILAASDDPQWVHALLGVLQRRKIGFID